jgi:hypothetical protein
MELITWEVMWFNGCYFEPLLDFANLRTELKERLWQTVKLVSLSTTATRTPRFPSDMLS